jgi:hypothetical protein
MDVDVDEPGNHCSAGNVDGLHILILNLLTTNMRYDTLIHHDINQRLVCRTVV